MSNTRPKLTNYGLMSLGGEATHMAAPAGTDYLRSYPIDASSMVPEVIRDEHMRQHDYETQVILGAYKGTLNTKHDLHGFASTVPTAAPTLNDGQANGDAYDSLINVLADAIGQWNGGGGHIENDTIGSSGAPVDTLTATSWATFEVGEAVAWAAASGLPAYYVGWIKSIAGGNATLLQTTPPVIPVSGVGDFYGSHPMIWLPQTTELDPYSRNASNGHTKNQPASSWELHLYGHDADDYLICDGCKPIGVKMSFSDAKLATLEITWGVSYWQPQGAGGAPNVGTYAFPLPEPGLSRYCAWGATAATSLILKNLEIDIGITREPMVDSSRAGGVGGYYTAKRTPVVGFDVYREHAAEWAAFTGQTSVPWTFQHGTQPGRIFACCMPAPRILEPPARKDDAGAVMHSVKLTPGYYSGDTGSASEITPVDSSFRIAFL